MRSLGKKYPGICTLPIGQNEVILINDLQLLKDMLAMKSISNRSPIFIDMVGNGKTHATMNGDYWLKNKKITQSIINTFAIKNIDKMIHRALEQEIFPKIDQENVINKQPFYPRRTLRYTFFWVFFRLIYGKNSNYDPSDQVQYDQNLDKHLKRRIVPYTSAYFGLCVQAGSFFFKYVSPHYLQWTQITLYTYSQTLTGMGGTFYKYHNAYLEVLQKHWNKYMNETEEKQDRLHKNCFQIWIDHKFLNEQYLICKQCFGILYSIKFKIYYMMN